MEFERQLFSHQSEKIKINIVLGFDSGSLVLHGYDIGETVAEYLGSSDHEYSVTVKEPELEKLYQANGLAAGQKEELVDLLSGRIYGNQSYSMFQSYLREKEVRFDAFRY